MGKARRFDSHSNAVNNERAMAQMYGQARQNLSGVGSTFRSGALSVNKSTQNPTIASAGDNLGNHTATQDLDMNGNDIILSTDGDTKLNVVGANVLFQCSNSGASTEVFRISATQLQMAQNLDLNANDIIGVANIDLDGVAATIQGVVNVNFYQTSQEINSLAQGLVYQAAAGDTHDFVIGGASKFKIGTSTVETSLTTKASSATEIGFQVGNESLTVGSEGSMILPYIESAENTPSDSTLDGWFGNVNGAIGLQYYTTAPNNRIWVRLNGTWVKAFAT